MEAFIVAPAPPKTSPSNNSPPADPNTSDTPFAPALSQAMQNRKNSSERKHDDTMSAQSSSASDSSKADKKGDINPSEDFVQEGEELASAASGIALEETAKLQFSRYFSSTSTLPSFGGGETKTTPNSPAQGMGNTLQTVYQHNIPAQQGLKTAISATAGFSQDGLRETAFLKNTDSLFSSSTMAALQANGATMASVQTHGSFLHSLGKNDMVTVIQRENKLPQMVLQNALVPTQSEEAVFAPKNNLSPEKIIAHLTDLSQEVATTSLRDKNHPLRQDVNSQFYTAKIQLENGSGKQNSGQQLLQNNDEAGNQNSQTSAPKLSNSSVETQFSQSLTTFAGDKTNHQLPVEQIRPAVPFLNSPVSENEILQQVIQKFRISQHLQDSRVVMKLHPAELGELKVDIHLKDGTINASIQVQSRQVLEILEKNMPRLREIMEQQGLRIDEMVLNIDKDMPADHNLFEEQLAQNDNPFFNRKRSASQLSFELNTEASTPPSAENNTLPQAAINVTI